MKLCPKCDFIYEDDQGFCDMDGKELVYEPTLQTPSQGAAIGGSLELVPLSNSLQPPGFEAAPRIFGIHRSLGLVIAAGLLLAIMLVAAVWISRHSFSSRRALSYNSESQNAKPGTSYPASEVNKVAPPAVPLQSSANQQAGDESSSNAGSNNRGVITLADSKTPVSRPSASPIKALPGIKPLPRLEPLPRLRPLPRLQEQKRPAGPSAKSSSTNSGNVNTKKESGVTSFLKKTGRILKKPFKF
jgi:hypothetical protein